MQINKKSPATKLLSEMVFIATTHEYEAEQIS